MKKKTVRKLRTFDEMWIINSYSKKDVQFVDKCFLPNDVHDVRKNFIAIKNVKNRIGTDISKSVQNRNKIILFYHSPDERGQGVDSDLKEAVRNRGYQVAQIHLGVCYQRGFGVNEARQSAKCICVFFNKKVFQKKRLPYSQ